MAVGDGGGRRRPWTGALAALTALALVAAACSSGDGRSSSGTDLDRRADPAAEVTTEGITGEVNIRATQLDHPVRGEGVEPIGPVVDVTTDGSVRTGATVTVDAGEPVGDDVVVAVTAESAGGPWDPLPVTVTGRQVTATIEHLSLFSFLRFPDPADAVEDLFNDVTADLFASARPPSCDDERGARTEGYAITSKGPDVLKWCLGCDDRGRFLRVVNNRRYPVILSSSLAVRDADAARGLGDRLADVLAGDRIALPPRSEVTFAADIGPGAGGLVRAELDGLAYSLYQLQVGVELAGAFLTRFGTRAPTPRSLDALLADAGCIDALVAAAPGRILTSCLDYEGLSAIFGGLGAAIATPIVLSAGVLSFFQTAAVTLWDEISGRDGYAIVLLRGAPPATTVPRVTCPAPDVDAYAQLIFDGWNARDLSTVEACVPATDEALAELRRIVIDDEAPTRLVRLHPCEITTAPGYRTLECSVLDEVGLTYALEFNAGSAGESLLAIRFVGGGL